ncbi:transcriptional regulator FtrA [Methylobacterium pseudosasicola]|uniref:AraC family transcriptional regulator, transcriptional activator FtrA n=1 Tax=Methylobacterium pseudosasicola TaxID=582667 RepID=A0A1I4NZ59_9HYPH|nr:transcriptional regulator FtrA [Methylobacterium pseudosasicola]SFM20695.1 AraC family transcriptional regulator, transcriptional activator FtrA [Methylobacterium pseudosasicola]
MPKSPQPTVVILAYDGLCTFEYGCAVEIFALPRPEFGARWYRCAIAAAEPGPLRGTGGVVVRADGGLELLDTAGTIVIPGWRGPTGAIPPALLDALRRAHLRGTRLVSICAGAFVLAEAGLLAGRRATTHWHFTDRLAAYPGVRVAADVLYVDEGSILTSAGSAAGLDLCLHVVRTDFGARVANRVARRMVVHAHRDGGQAQFVQRPVPKRAGAKLGLLFDRVRENLGAAWTVERMASEAGLSLRSLHRHVRAATGLAPGTWLIAERVTEARAMLEETTRPVDEIARLVGFGAAPTLRSHFRSLVGVTPTAYRRSFTTRAAGPLRAAA